MFLFLVFPGVSSSDLFMFSYHTQSLISYPYLTLVPMWISGFTTGRQGQWICYILMYEVKENVIPNKFILHLFI